MNDPGSELADSEPEPPPKRREAVTQALRIPPRRPVRRYACRRSEGTCPGTRPCKRDVRRSPAISVSGSPASASSTTRRPYRSPRSVRSNGSGLFGPCMATEIHRGTTGYHTRTTGSTTRKTTQFFGTPVHRWMAPAWQELFRRSDNLVVGVRSSVRPHRSGFLVRGP